MPNAGLGDVFGNYKLGVHGPQLYLATPRGAARTPNVNRQLHLRASTCPSHIMSSLPAQRPASQHRRPSPPAQQQQTQRRNNSFSGQSVDSQTLLLNSPPTQAADSACEEQQQETPSQGEQQDEAEPRKCWICLNDETEDDETTSEWRSPCACSLVAHETCLLDWIADMEAPTSGRRVGTTAGKVLCPQCKGEYVIQRPKSYVVEAVRGVERLVSTLRLPGFALVTGAALYSTLTLSGTATIYQIFGTKDAMQILGPLYETPNPAVNSLAVRCLDHLRHHWRLDLGLPLIPVVLVASRTTFADSFLPFLPLIFFVSSGQSGDEILQLQWPPSAAFTFATLPYLRGFYNAYYDRVWLPREQQWLKEIQPRAGEDVAANAQVPDEGDPALDEVVDDGEVIEQVEIEIDFDMDMFRGWGDPGNGNGDGEDEGEGEGEGEEAHDDNHDDAREQPPEAVAPGPAAAEAQREHNDEHAENPIPIPAPAPNIPLHPPQQPPAVAAPPRPRRVRRDHATTFSTTSLADTLLGALIFPTLAAAMGELLRHVLPTDWVTPPMSSTSSPAFSWLVATWQGGGGSGLKDALMLYVRWRSARNHRRRGIVNRDKGRK
ncbi:Zinc finger RING-CH-type [Pyrenophora seminiperda CCB06]|uniref:Zinc finger RING-CH-type n=1 Tax=Pyrenophora seminiperda CCB06 TaxID=1302712 RepID=A0A3M7MEB2_9PLEO|nr:Zinc finger RING-CH-type [Pyrenophora seminiperda CCB06]